MLVLNLYHRLPFGRLHRTNPEVVALADLIGRSPDAVAYKLGNFAALDPSIDRKGFANFSKMDEAIWNEFLNEGEHLTLESEQARVHLGQPSLFDEVEDDGAPDGLEREAFVRLRVNQSYFRRMILARYEETCCVTGLRLSPLLVAAHIVPWAEDPRLRLRPENGLCLNALHDRAFEKGIIVIQDDFTIRVANAALLPDKPGSELLLKYDGAPLRLPRGVAPSPTLLARHRARVASLA